MLCASAKLAQLLGYAVLTCGCEGDIASEITFHKPVLSLVRQARDQKSKSPVLVGKVGGVVVLRPHLIAAVHLVEETSVSSDRLLQVDALKIPHARTCTPPARQGGLGTCSFMHGEFGCIEILKNVSVCAAALACLQNLDGLQARDD